MEVGGQCHIPATLPPEKSLRYTLYKKLGGPFGKEKNLLLLPGIEPQPSNPQANAIPTELSVYNTARKTGVLCMLVFICSVRGREYKIS
jgi:hypothetical protein